MKALIRVRMGPLDGHYGGNLVDGARILALFGDVATELCIREGGDEGLFRAYDKVEFLKPVYAGDYVEAEGEIVGWGRTSLRMEFVARKVIAGVTIRGALVQVGPHAIDRAKFDWGEVERNPLFCPDARTAQLWADYLDDVRKDGSSIGAVIEIVAEGVPAGWGAPVYGKLDADLAAAMMSINAVKGVEIGAGFRAAALTGEENADEMRAGNPGPTFLSNNAGGVLGGISTGQPVVVRFAVKPTSSILTPRRTIDRSGKETEIVTKGRHDPCVGIRAVPVGEAMMACVLADHFLRHRGQMG